jgi:tetraacyldisaccharide 4'-kinase
VSGGGRLVERVSHSVQTERPTGAQQALRVGLALLSFGYGALIRLRNAGYALKILRTHRLPCRVLCVGNLTVGGTGKTPTVIALAAALTAAGSRVCVLLRGYRREGCGVAVVSDGAQLLRGWREAGDEAVLLARSLPGVPVVVGGDRVAAGRLAVDQFRPEVILLDDGFQHRRLRRDADLVLLDAMDPFGGGWLLPRGRLREPVSSLGRAHAILVTRADQAGDLARLRRRVGSLVPRTPVGLAVYRPCRLLDLPSRQERPLEELRGKRVFAMSGIANPQGFQQTLVQAGAQVAGSLAFADHHVFTPEDDARVVREARAVSAEWIVTTEKDAVRLDRQPTEGLSWMAMGVHLEVIDGAAALEAALGIPVRSSSRG